MDMIMMHKVLDTIYSKDTKGNPTLFDITFCSADRNLKTGGELIELQNVHVTARPEERQNTVSTLPVQNNISKAQNHRKHRTLNLYSPVAQRFFKVHRDLMLVFNGKLIVW
jgi:hypothetical protein